MPSDGDTCKISLRLLSKRHHCDQIVTGFLMLQKRLGFQLDISRVDDFRDSNIPLVEARINGRLVYYDLEDSYWTVPHMKELLDSCSAYFKRSFSSSENMKYFSSGQQSRMHPLGLNYSVQCAAAPWKAKMLYDRRIFPWNNFSSKAFESEPHVNTKPVVLFSTRLWDPASVEEPYKEDFYNVSMTRIALLRILKERFPDNLVGGLYDTPYARAQAPDLITPPVKTLRRSYLNSVKKSDIIITSTGLHGSIGGRFGEAIAASRAVITEPLLYEVPGLIKGENYLEYRSVEECAGTVAELISSPEQILRIQKANREYYENYLRPDVLIENSLQQAGISIKGQKG